jgi:predicted RNA-binding protein with PUA-like domain
MARWLFKEEPDHYSFADLVRDRTTLWDGVSNALALQYLRQVRRGDRILIYHSGKEKAVVGEAVAMADPEPDPGSEDPKLVAVRVRAVRQLPHALSLSRIKEDSRLADWELVRLPRLSVMPVTNVQWRCVEELGQKGK